MGELRIRRIPFEFEDVEFIWNPDNPAFSIIGNMTSFGAVGFERWLCAAFRQAQERIEDEAVHRECDLFIKQEAIHSAVHARHCRELIARYPELATTLRKSIDYFARLLDERPLEFNLAVGAALESTFTPAFKLIIDNRKRFMYGGDARVTSALLWHFCEEIEHRSSAWNVHLHLYGNRYRRLEVLRWSVRYMMGFRRLMTKEFVRAVPEEVGTTRLPEVWEGVPRAQIARAAVHILMTQTPWHDPDRAALPSWAESWHDAYDAGADMTQYVGVRRPVAA